MKVQSFAGNEPLVTPDWLIEDKLFRASDCQIRSFPPIEIDYDAVIHRLNVFLISIPPFRESPDGLPIGPWIASLKVNDCKGEQP